LDLKKADFLDNCSYSGFVQLAIVVPGTPKSANKAANIRETRDLIATYFKKTLYPLSEEAASVRKTSAAACSFFFSNAAFMFLNYSPDVNLQFLDAKKQEQFLLDENLTMTVKISRALQLKKVRRKDDCCQKVSKMTVVHCSDATNFDSDDENVLYIKTCSFKVILELQDDASSATNRCDLDNAYTCVQNGYWAACSRRFGWSSGTDARVRTLFGQTTSFCKFKDIQSTPH
jgi:hypothetical protein